MTDKVSARKELDEWVSRARLKYYLSEVQIEEMLAEVLKRIRCSNVARL